MANIFESAFMTLKNGMTMYFADSKARQWLQKLQEALAKKYGPDNPPPATEGSRIWYATCSTASGTGAKTATTSTGDFVLATGSMVRILFTTSNTAANPTISIDGSAAKAIRPISSSSGMANKIAAGEVIDLVYDGSNFVMTKGNAATTSFYGITKLSSATNSTAEDVAATPKAVKDAADAKVAKSGDTMTGNLYVAKAGNAYVQAENLATGTKLNFDSGSSTNHGIYTYGYYDGSSFHSDPKWMIYRGPDGIIRVNGYAENVTGTVAVAKGGTGATTAEGARDNLCRGLSYTTNGLVPSGCTIVGGGYAKLGNIVIVNIRIQVTSVGAFVQGFPKPVLAGSGNFLGGAGYDTVNERAAYFYVNSNGFLVFPAALGTGTFLLSLVYLTSD